MKKNKPSKSQIKVPSWNVDKLRELVEHFIRLRRGGIQSLIVEYSLIGLEDILPYLLNPDLLIDEIHKTPTFIDSPTSQVCIRVLRLMCHNHDRPERVDKWASKTLRKVLIASIPKQPTRQPLQYQLYYWREMPDELEQLVKDYENKIKPFVDLGKTWRDNKQRNPKKPTEEANLEKAFRKIHQRPMPKGLLNGDRGNGLTTIALAFIHDEYKVSYEALKKLYYSIAATIREQNKALCRQFFGDG